MEKTLADFLLSRAEATDTLATLAALVDKLRPVRGEITSAEERLRELVAILDARPDLRGGLRDALLQLFAQRHAVLLFATSGIYPETGVVAETLRRISHKLLPEADNAVQLKDVFGQIFRRSDAGWLEGIPLEDWIALIDVLRFDEVEDRSAIGLLVADMFEALRVVAHRVAAAGLEPEMLRLDPSLENHESPFLALCEEALTLVNQAKPMSGNTAAPTNDERHLLVLIDQAREAIERVRRQAQQMGASFYLTFRLRRLAQHLDRLETLASIAGDLGRDAAEDVLQRGAALWRELAIAECRRNDLRRFWRRNAELVALRVTENAGRSGEHYIGTTRSEYFAMLRSAAGGGFIIAFMAANKYFLSKLGLAPLAEVLAFSLNYGLGFVLIHMLHFTVATKQPAMTANAIAAAIGEAQGNGRERERNFDPLVTLVARTVRTQVAAILGNIALAVPTAILFALALRWLTGESFIDADKARHLLADIDPVGSAALVFAAVAGVCLFLAGLIAGYYDNLCAYNRIPERLFQLRLPRRLFGDRRWRHFADYVENNLGALAGNFFFGFLLGGTAGLGVLLGLPLDIRHIAFSAAYWGYAMFGLNFAVEWQIAALAALGVLAIGMVNLAVSFYLAMWVGLKARGVNFAQRREFAGAIARRLLRQPREFFMPPKAVDDAKGG